MFASLWRRCFPPAQDQHTRYGQRYHKYMLASMPSPCQTAPRPRADAGSAPGCGEASRSEGLTPLLAAVEMRRTNRGALLMRLAVLSLLAQGGGAFRWRDFLQRGAHAPPRPSRRSSSWRWKATLQRRAWVSAPTHACRSRAWWCPLTRQGGGRGLCATLAARSGALLPRRLRVAGPRDDLVAILPMGAEFGYSDSTKGLVAAGFSVGYCLGSSCRLRRVHRLAQVVLGGLLIWSVAQALTPAAAALGVRPLCAMRAVMGMGEAAAVPCLQSLAANFVPASQRASSGAPHRVPRRRSRRTCSPPPSSTRRAGRRLHLFGGAGDPPSLPVALCGADGPDDPRCSRLGGSGDARARRARRRAHRCPPPPQRRRRVPWREMAVSRPVWRWPPRTCPTTSSATLRSLGCGPTSTRVRAERQRRRLRLARPFVAGASARSARAQCATPSWRAASRHARPQGHAGGAPPPASLGPCHALPHHAASPPTPPPRRPGELPRPRRRDAAARGARRTWVAPSTAPRPRPLRRRARLQSCFAAGYGCGAQDISTKYASLIYGATSVFAVLIGSANTSPAGCSRPTGATSRRCSSSRRSSRS